MCVEALEASPVLEGARRLFPIGDGLLSLPPISKASEAAPNARTVSSST